MKSNEAEPDKKKGLIVIRAAGEGEKEENITDSRLKVYCVWLNYRKR